ncbi:unnamed protein product [Owenia fusiformis]|uniref:Uncharacterized protein n=1 Tax=Owenia fusiformis TaxID=6347 RepID=A0A8J1Y7L9_OWEFU|nr:unnamed protein product [Owenia fusiformis]
MATTTMASHGHYIAEKRVKYTEVVVIGNGPSALTLSYLLAGNRCYYNGNPHPNEFLGYKLDENRDQSLIEQDLEYLSAGLEGRSSNPVAILFDNLTHPDADFGTELPSLLEWKKHEEQAIPHVVLGRGPPGGAWQMMEGSMQTLSLGNWMELPGLPFKQWLADHRISTPVLLNNKSSKHDRASMNDVKNYYEAYVSENKLEKYFQNNTIVTSVQRVVNRDEHEIDSESGEVMSSSCNGQIWEVRGYHLNEEMCMGFCYRSRNVVIATGTYDIPNKLGLPGENQHEYILHSIAELEKVIESGELRPDSSPLAVVGAGLSAADGILTAKSMGIPVKHICRRHCDDPMLIYNKLPSALYPEYHQVLRMMKNEEKHEGYECFPKHRILDLMQDNKILISGDGSPCDRILEVSYLLVLIGSRPDLSFLPNEGKDLGIVPNCAIHCKHNPIDVDPYSYQSVHEPGLFAMGPIVGDNFVRFLRGGALGIASTLYKNQSSDKL